MFGDNSSRGCDSYVVDLQQTAVVKLHFNFLMIFVIFIVQTNINLCIFTLNSMAFNMSRCINPCTVKERRQAKSR